MAVSISLSLSSAYELAPKVIYLNRRYLPQDCAQTDGKENTEPNLSFVLSTIFALFTATRENKPLRREERRDFLTLSSPLRTLRLGGKTIFCKHSELNEVTYE